MRKLSQVSKVNEEEVDRMQMSHFSRQYSVESYFKEKTEHEKSKIPGVKRKLILHFDQHNTIQVACTLPGRCVTVEEGLNNFLTSAVWGREVDDKWIWCCNEPQIHKPKTDTEGVITYFKYLEKKIVKTPDDRAELKKRTCRFVYEEPGSQFREFFDLYLQSLIYDAHWPPRFPTTTAAAVVESQSSTSSSSSRASPTKDVEAEPSGPLEHNEKPADPNQNGKHAFQDDECKPARGDRSPCEPVKTPELPSNTIKGGDPSDPKLYHLILPEFFDMIRRLQKDGREFAIVLRTMGIDSHNFLETITPVLSGKHPQFADILPMHINTSVGHLKRYSLDHIELEMDGEVYRDESSIYEKLNSLTGICAIRDDFAYWQKNSYLCYSAKPLWVNLNDERHQHILFDDNIRLDSKDDCIANVRFNNTEDENEYHNVDFESYKIFERTSIIQPNLIELLNPLCKKDSRSNHYYDKIRQAEANFSLMLLHKTKFHVDTTIDELSDSDENSDPNSELDDSNGLNRSRKFSRITTPPNFPVTKELLPRKLEKTLDEESDEQPSVTAPVAGTDAAKPLDTDELRSKLVACELVDATDTPSTKPEPTPAEKAAKTRYKRTKNFVRINTGFTIETDDCEKPVVSTACSVQ